MAININVIVGDLNLVDQVTIQQSAGRQALLEKEISKQTEVEGTTARTEKLADQGKDANGDDKGNKKRRRDGDYPLPASARITPKETVSAAVVRFVNTDWVTLGPLYRRWYGTNKGPSIFLSSLDGSYWLEDRDLPEGIANWDLEIPELYEGGGIGGGFGTGDLTMWQYCIFPAGRGSFILTMRLQQAAAVSWFDGEGGVFGNASTPQEAFFSYSVFQSFVKRISTPEAAKNFLRRKNSKLVNVVDEEYGLPGIGFDPPWLANSSIVGVGINTSMSFDYINPGEEGEPTPSRDDIGRSSPFIYAMNDHEGGDITNYSNITDFNNAKYQAGKLNSTGKSYARRIGIVVDSWFPEYLEEGADEVKNLGQVKIDLYRLNGEVFIDWKTPLWGILSEFVRNVFEFWIPSKKVKTIGSSLPSSLAFKTPSLVPDDDVAQGGKRHVLVCSDWAMPAFCRQKLLALGFTEGDITPSQ